jgi:hypothetical protein
MIPAAARPTGDTPGPANGSSHWLDLLRMDTEAAQLRQLKEQAERNSGGFVSDEPGGPTWVNRSDVQQERGASDDLRRDMAARRALEQFTQHITPQRGALARDEASRDSWQGAADESGQYWRYGEPREQAQFGREMDITEARALPARVAAESRLGVADRTQAGGDRRAQMALLESILSNLRAGEVGTTGYNQPRADQLGQEFDAARGVAMGAARPAAGGAGGLAPGQSRNPRIPPGTPSQQGPDGMYYLDPATGEYVHEEDY